MTAKPKILVVRDPAGRDAPLPIVTDGFEVEEVRIGAARLKSEDRPPLDAAIAALAKAGYPAHLEQ